MRSVVSVGTLCLLFGVVTPSIRATQSSPGGSSLEWLRQEMDSLQSQLSRIVLKEGLLLEEVKGVAHEIDRLVAELETEESILKEYRLATCLRTSAQLTGEMEALEREKLAATAVLKEMKRQLAAGLREKRRQLLRTAEKTEGEDLRKGLYKIALITLELERLQESMVDKPAARRAEMALLPSDSSVELREKAEIIKRQAAGMLEIAAALDKTIEAVKEEELMRRKLVELKEKVAWLEEENVPSERTKGRGHSYSAGEPDYGTDHSETTVKGPLSMESWEVFFGGKGLTRIAGLAEERKELQEKRRALLLRADSLDAMAHELLRAAEEMERLGEK